MALVEKVSNTAFGEAASRTILSNWKGQNMTDAHDAALRLGILVSSKLLPFYRTKEILESAFKIRNVDDSHWPTVWETFQSGRHTIVDGMAVRERYLPKAANDNQRFQVTRFGDVDQAVAKEEILKGVLGDGEFSLFVAKPGTAKSVLVGDIGCHIAAGLDWHGRKVQQGMVIFFAAERKKLTERRIRAWGKTHGVTDIPFYVVGGKLDLTSGLVDAKALAATIKAIEFETGEIARLIILDTVTRTFGQGDQHQSRDMQRYVQSVDELVRSTSAHVAAIHHSGWASDRGKGAVDLDGAVDVSFGISVKGAGPNKVFTLECTGANDSDEGLITCFKLESVELGTDSDGNVTTAPVVVRCDGPKTDGSNLKGNAAKALTSLETAIAEHGECPPDDAIGETTVSREQWRAQFYADARAKEPAVAEEALRKRFTRTTAELLEKGDVGSNGERWWIAGHAGHVPDN